MVFFCFIYFLLFAEVLNWRKNKINDLFQQLYIHAGVMYNDDH